MNLLTRNAYIGLILVFVCLTLFLNIRLAFWTTLGIPISFLGAFWLLRKTRENLPVRCGFLCVMLALIVRFEVNDRLEFSKATRFVSLLANARARELRGEHDKAREWRQEAGELRFTRSIDVKRCVSELHRRFGLDLANILPETELRNRIDLMITLDPLWTEPRSQRIAFLAADDEFDKAVDECRPLIEMQPKVSDHRALIGYILLRTKDVKNAKHELELAVALDPDEHTALVNLALIAAVENNRTKARQLLATVLQRNPRNPVARRLLTGLDESVEPVKVTLDVLSAPLGLEVLTVYVTAREADSIDERLTLLYHAAHYAPHVPSIRMRYAEALWAEARFAESFAQFEAALDAARFGRGRTTRMFVDRAADSLIRVLRALVIEHRKNGRPEQADALCRRALAVVPEGRVDDVMQIRGPQP